MATKWSKPVTREVETDKGAVNITITEKGVEIRKKGTQRAVTLDIERLLASGACGVPPEKREKWFWK